MRTVLIFFLLFTSCSPIKKYENTAAKWEKDISKLESLDQSEKYTDWALAYEPGRLYLAPIGNYNNQKWDVSNISNPNKSILTHNVNNNSYGALNKNGNSAEGEVHDPNKIKINLNLTDELKKQIFGESVGKTSNGDDQGSTSDFYKQKCDRYISGDAIESICPGCDTDKL